MLRRWRDWRERPTAKICSCSIGDILLVCTLRRRGGGSFICRRKYSEKEQKKKNAFGEKVGVKGVCKHRCSIIEPLV